MLSPGLGHVYLREWLRAVLWFGLILSATSVLVPVSTPPSILTVDAVLQASLSAAEETPLRNEIALFAITSLSMVDAYWMATRGNQRAETADGVNCPHCGRAVDEDLAFCHWCTNRLEPGE